MTNMRLYFAGNVVSEAQEQMLCGIAGLQYRLLSFAEIDDWGKEAFEFWTSERAPGPFFLDSGAFGALTRGATIDLKRYCTYIQAHIEQATPYASLDVIGDWLASAANYDAMRTKGLEPVPTLHMGSPGHELRRLLKDTDYLALGGVVGASRKQMQPWLDGCFSIIRDYWPKKIHLFGVTAQWALERYPVFSADSSSALVGAGMGRVSIFEGGRLVSMSWRAYARATYDSLVMDGISPMRIRSGSAHRGRSVRNVQCFLALERHVTKLWARRGVTWE